MEQRALLTQEALDWIGHEYASRKFLVAEHDILRFIHASRDTGWTQNDSSIDKPLQAPPMFYVVLRTLPYQLAPIEKLDYDGTIADDLPPIEATRGMAGEIEVEFGKPMVAGDVVTVTKRIVDIVEKQGRSGPFVIITFLTEYWDEDGRLFVRERFGRILR